MNLTKTQKDAILDEVREEIEVLDNMSMYGTARDGYSRREQCAYIDGLKALKVDFETEQEREAYQVGLARREDIINFNRPDGNIQDMYDICSQ